MKISPFFVLLLPVCELDAALLAYEGFDASSYTTGAALSGQTSASSSGFTGSWHSPTLNASGNTYWASSGGTASANNFANAGSGQASYTGLTPTAGQASYRTNFTGGTANQVSIQRDFSTVAPAPTNLFVSTLITIDGSSGVSLGFGSVLSGDQATARPFQFGFLENGTLFAKGNSTGHPVLNGPVYGSGTYWVVAEFVNGSTNNDTINLWVNPTIGLPLGTPTLSYSGTTTTGSPNFYVGATANWTISGVVLDFKSTGTTAGTTTVDEIRIGNVYADVIPEPSVPLLSLLGLGCLLIRRTR